MKKRIMSLLLAVVMVLGMIPMTVMADEAVVAEACEHTATTEIITSNEDGTHTVKDVCDECGETLEFSFEDEDEDEE